jgi:HAD superfamily hydrolase (TIGR01490 family)
MPGKKAAFFDFDKTLIDCESSKLLIAYMRKNRRHFFSEKGISLTYLIKLLVLNELYKRHLYSDEKMALLLISFFKDRKLSTFEDIAPELYRDYIKQHLSPVLMDRVEWHRKQGDLLVLISAGLRYILSVVKMELHFDHLLCTDLETGTDGILTGRTSGIICIDSNKKLLCEILSKEEGIDLKSSSAYGNHQSDIPMLESVGQAFAVEPTEPLLRVALQKGWPVFRYNR